MASTLTTLTLAIAAACFSVCVSSAFASSASSEHEVLTFDYGWRFYLGDPSGPPPTPPAPPPPTPSLNCSNLAKVFPMNQSMQLNGLNHNGASDAEKCAAACCEIGNSTCWVWQYNSTQGCWLGFATNTFPKPNHDWVGASRGSVPPTLPPTIPSSIPPNWPKNPPASTPSFDDSKWELVDVPHDYIVEQQYNQNIPSDQGPTGNPGGAGQSYLPRDVAYYRKHFHLPTAWSTDKAIWIRFDGVFRATKLWLNGVAIREHAAFAGDAHGETGGAMMGGGYTSFDVRLDNLSGVVYGDDDENVLTVYVDPRQGSGWFYEGGGIYRKTYLHAAPPVHFETDGVFVHSNVSGVVKPHVLSSPKLGVSATSASVFVSATLVNTLVAIPETVLVTFDVFNSDGQLVVSAKSAGSGVTINGAESKAVPATATTGTISMVVSNVELWSIARPHLYTLQATITRTDGGDDVFNTTFGVYSTKWTGDQGLFMNEQHIKVRGFCNHESFGGVGMAIPDRVNLFRAQTLRSVGGNGWRMSHNPVTPGLLDVLDRVGVVVMEETRIMGTDNITIMNMGAMVKRDRNHPSIIIWSFCNEGGCRDGAEGFRNITNVYDTTRPKLANRHGNPAIDPFTDVEGFSHQSGETFDTYNAANPSRPKFASECCSCSSQRSSTQGINAYNETATVPGLSCTASQSNESNARDFMVGTMVWTLFDYYGESHGWPRVSSAYGQIDLAGFIKNTGYWYRTWWLSAVPQSDAGRPTGFGAAHACHAFSEGGGLMVYTEAPSVKLYTDGNHSDTHSVAPLIGAYFQGTHSAVKNTTVVCGDAQGNPTATTTIITAGNATAIVLSIDAPSVLTGTGSSLVLDGHDVALLRATIVDAAGTVVDSNANVSFVVTNGPGRVLATHNGDNACHEPNHASWHSAYVGLVRCVVQVTEHFLGSESDRALLASIDVDTAHTTVPQGAGPAPTTITVTATSAGLRSASVTIAVSTDESRHGVLAAATHSFQTEQAWP